MFNDLDKLIKQVIAEKTVKSFDLNTDIISNLPDEDGSSNQWSKPISPSTNLRTTDGREKHKERLIRLAKVGDGEVNNVSLKDIKAAFEAIKKNNEYESDYKYALGRVVKRLEYLATGAGSSKDNAVGALQAIKAIKISVESGDIEKLKDYFQATRDAAALDTKDPEYSEQGVFTADLPYRSLGEERGWIAGNTLKPARAISPEILAVFKKGTTDAGDLETYFSNLQSLGRMLSLAAGTTDKELEVDVTYGGVNIKTKADAVEALKKMPADELFNTATILKTLGNLAKESQGASAGTIFETFLALSLGGVVFGGSGGAADMLSGDRGQLLFSAKQHEGKPGGGQSATNFMIELALSADKKPMYYIAMAKRGGQGGGTTEKDFNRLDIHFSGIKFIGDSSTEDVLDPQKYACYTADGTAIGTLSGQIPKDKKKGASYDLFFTDSSKAVSLAKANKFAKPPQWEITYAKEADFKIPISTSFADPGSIATFDKMFIDAVEATTDTVKIAIKNMNIAIKKMQDKSQQYIANHDSDVANEIGTAYGSLKQDILGGLGELGTGEEKTQIKGQAAFAESVDKLVEAVIKQKLLK